MLSSYHILRNNSVSKIVHFVSLFFVVFLLFSTSSAQELTDTTSQTNIGLSDNPITNKINSSAKDSIDYDLANNKVYLYNEAIVEYEDIVLKAAFIELDSDKNTVYACSLKNDSTGVQFGFPVFSEKGKSFTANELTYNFDTKKGIINGVKTQEGEGYLLGQKIKKMPNDVVYASRGRYTTCDHDPPHFSIRANRIKTIPNDKIVTGPAVLEFAGVPTPLAVPFGFFPNQSKQSSGLIFPFYGESANQGFFLKNGGYFFAISDYLNVSITGDIYTRGSWNVKANSNYKMRYKYSGSFDVGYSSLKSGNHLTGTFSDFRDFSVRWQHRQDPKVNPKMKFSANVNAGTGTYQQNNFSNDSDYLKNTLNSRINLSRTFTNSSLGVDLKHSQSTLTKRVDLSLPAINYSVNKFYPFKRLNSSSKSKWFDKIGISYNSKFDNKLSIADSLLFNKNTFSEFNNGMRHEIPISTSFNALKYLTISPSFRYLERWYFDRIEKQWKNNELITDTVNGFFRAYNYSFNLSTSTKIYGVLNFNSNIIKAIRHVISPRISFSYVPDFSSNNFDFYDLVQVDSLGNTQTYSYYQNGLYGTPSKNTSSNIGVAIGNFIEIKVGTKDTLKPIKKVKLLEGFNISTNYNLLADSLNLSNINISGVTKLFKKLNFRFRAVFDPYQSKNGQKINAFYLSDTYMPARFINATSSLNFGLKGGENTDDEDVPHWLDYVDFDVPWNLSVSYTLDYNKQNIDQVSQSLNFSGDLSLTEKWKIGFNSGYDFINKDLTYTSLNIYRDLHCWEMIVKWIPFGIRQSYNFTIRVKASVLQDLKWERKKDWYDY